VDGLHRVSLNFRAINLLHRQGMAAGDPFASDFGDDYAVVILYARRHLNPPAFSSNQRMQFF
jgi:hypothetical protein